MKLWEALEKSHRVWRKSWDAEVRPFDITKREAISINEFQADDWEPLEEPVAETALDRLGKTVGTMVLNETAYGIISQKTEMLNLLIDVLKEQQTKIQQLESEQQKWKHMSIAEVDSGIAISGTGGSRYAMGGIGKPERPPGQKLSPWNMI